MKGNDVFNDGNSRWGIKVVEDLGGGMKFTGQFEQNINYEDGSTATTSARYAYGQLSGGFGASQVWPYAVSLLLRRRCLGIDRHG